MDQITGGWSALCAVALVLGMRHGLDADHLAIIDSLTRLSHRSSRRRAALSGIEFSLGHGCIVLGTAFVAVRVAGAVALPAWLPTVGAIISIGLLFAAGAFALRSVLNDPPESVTPTGPRTWAMRRFARRIEGSAAFIVGMLFAISFDTLSQAALFAAMASEYGGVARALQLGGFFVAGMVLVDGANGLWIAHLLRKSAECAAIASRTLAMVIAASSLAVGSIALTMLLNESAAEWLRARSLLLSAAVIVLTAGAFAVGTVLGRRRRRARSVAQLATALQRE